MELGVRPCMSAGQELLTTEVDGGSQRKPEYHFESPEHEKNDGPIFHAGFRIKIKVKGYSPRW
jgi:hypothetical protein